MRLLIFETLTAVAVALILAALFFLAALGLGCGHLPPTDPKVHIKHPWRFDCGDGSAVRLELSQYEVTYKTAEIYDRVETLCKQQFEEGSGDAL